MTHSCGAKHGASNPEGCHIAVKSQATFPNLSQALHVPLCPTHRSCGVSHKRAFRAGSRPGHLPPAESNPPGLLLRSALAVRRCHPASQTNLFTFVLHQGFRTPACFRISSSAGELPFFDAFPRRLLWLLACFPTTSSRQVSFFLTLHQTCNGSPVFRLRDDKYRRERGRGQSHGTRPT